MSDYNEGDLVEASRGDAKIIDRLVNVRGEMVFPSADLSVTYLGRTGFTITVIEKAAPPLPTEPGVYADKNGGVWKFGKGEEGILSPNYAPYTRLEPVAETVEKIAALAESEYYPTLASQIRLKFGVTK